MRSQMTIGKKLTLGFATLLGVTLLSGVLSLIESGRLTGSFDGAVNVTVPKLQLIAAVDCAASDMLAGQRGVVAFTYAKRPENVESAKRMFNTAAGTWAASVAKMRPLLVTEEGRRLVGDLDQSLAAWQGAFTQLVALADAGKPDEAAALGITNVSIYEAANRNVKRLDELCLGLLEQDRQHAGETSTQSIWISGGLIALSLALGAIVLLAVRRGNRDLQQAATELGESARQVLGASVQVAGSSQSLAQGASEQAASLEETSASTEELNSMTLRNADNSRAAADLMADTARVVDEANRSLDQMQASMKEINASSDKIGKIIKVIDEIAFQTNILALNAAVEAARAGAAGMGFAVVADEVRNLAQRSAQAAKDTAALIEESITTSSEGSGKLDLVAGAIRNITESAQKVKVLVDEVKLGSEEQARGIEQIAKAISQMEQVTQKSAATAEEAASAGEELSAQGQSMGAIVDRMHDLIGRAAGVQERQRPRPELPVSKPAAPPIPPRQHAALRPALGVASRSSIPLDGDFKEF